MIAEKGSTRGCCNFDLNEDLEKLKNANIFTNIAMK